MKRRKRDEETINTPGDCSRCREDRCPLGREKAKVVKILGLFRHAKLVRTALRENENEAPWSAFSPRKFLCSLNVSHRVSIDENGMRKKGVHRARRALVYVQVCIVVRSLSTTGHHNILWHFCNSGRLLRIEKEIRRGRESDRSFNSVPRKREPARLARLWPTLLPTLRTLFPIEMPCYQVAKACFAIRG